MRTASGGWEGDYSHDSRFESGPGTNPEELIGAAHAGCFSMALAGALTRAGYAPQNIQTNANVHFEKLEEGWTITNVELVTEAKVPEILPEEFAAIAENAKRNCPVSRALTAEVTLKAKLVE